MKGYLLPILIIISATVSVGAQQVQNFSLVNVINNKPVGLENYSSSAGIVVIFTTNTCAFDDYYRARINKLSNDYRDKVPVLLVNSSVDPAESVDNMAKKAQQLSLSMPYLADKDQTLMQSFGASRTPQAFVLRNEGGKFSIIYRGAIDDNAQVEADVHRAYLKDTMDLLLANEKIETQEVRPVGCTIRKK
ncbi:MAG: redoxin domain-containing protein [Chryseolinea sp.]